MDLKARLQRYLSAKPTIDPSVYIAEGAIVIGSVELAASVSIWHNATLRGDINSIFVGEGSNIQDNAVLHLADEQGVQIGRYVTVGHSAVIHACTIEDECLIGMHATLLDSAVIGKQSIVGAGALVTKGMLVPEGSLVLGSPAKVVRSLTPEERRSVADWADKYIETAQFHKKLFSQQKNGMK